jgi:uncharacterized repeat protein (TIGR01451 family)
MKKKSLLLYVGLGMMLIASCTATKTMWIPVYSISGGGENDVSSYDAAKSLVVNPKENTVYAYFKADKSEGIVFANKYNISFSEKVTYNISNNNYTIDEAKSTKKKISYLTLWKSFYYAPVQNTQDTAAIFYYNDDRMIIFNNARLKDGEKLQFDILGRSTGTLPIGQVIVVDVLPPGLQYASSEYFFRNENGVFKHKVVKQDGREAVVLDADLKKPLNTGEDFIIRVSVTVAKGIMEKMF